MRDLRGAAAIASAFAATLLGACASEPALPPGWIVVGEAAALQRALAPADALPDTPLARFAATARARLASCTGVAHGVAPDAESLAGALTCGPPPFALAPAEARASIVVLAPGDEPRTRFDVRGDENGDLTIDAALTATWALAPLALAEAPEAPDLLNSEGALLYAHYARKGGLYMPSFLPLGSGAAARALFTGEIEVVVPAPAPGARVAPGFAFVTRTEAAAREAVALFGSIITAAFSATPEKVAIAVRGEAREADCLTHAALAVGFAPCAIAVKSALVFAFTQGALERALAASATGATGATSVRRTHGGFVDVDAMRRADAAIAAAQPALRAPPALPPFSRVVLTIPTSGVWRATLTSRPTTNRGLGAAP